MKPSFQGLVRASKTHVWLAVLLLLAAFVGRVISAEPPTLTEPEVKANCLLNFAKYVDWPATALDTNNGPITIGCVTNGEVFDQLKAAAEGKLIGGRKVDVINATNEVDWKKCQVLFVNVPESRRARRILRRVKGTPVLTVGESDQFIQQGGAINFVKKEDKVHFDIDVTIVRAAHLEISSTLLSLADNVEGGH